MIKMRTAGILRAALLPALRTGGSLAWGTCVVDGWAPMPVFVANVADFSGIFVVGRGVARPSNPVPGMLFYDTNSARLMYYNDHGEWATVE